MCVFRVHIKLSNFRNILSGIKKIVNIFSILEKIFPNIGGLRTHINKIFHKIPTIMPGAYSRGSLRPFV